MKVLREFCCADKLPVDINLEIPQIITFMDLSLCYFSPQGR